MSQGFSGIISTVGGEVPAGGGRGGRVEAVVVVPTYNEGENLVELVHRLLGLPCSLEVIVVDDASPDGTGVIADRLAGTFPQVTVVHRPGKGGRGSACIAGFRVALRRDADYICEMDADLSHDPDDLPALLRKGAECDVVIGSRYAEGARIVNWPPVRRVFSRLANQYARAVLGIRIRDYTNGFRCYRKAVLAAVDFSRIDTHGHAVLSEMAFQLHRRGFRIEEVPTVFTDRRRGTSNVSLGEIADAFLSLLRLRWRAGQ